MKIKVINYWLKKNDTKIFALFPSIIFGISEYENILDFEWLGFRLLVEFIKSK
jgi:hypothetical protein